MLDYQRLQFNFNPDLANSTEGREISQVAIFPTRIRIAIPVIGIFDVRFTDDDHSFGRFVIFPVANTPQGNTVRVTLRLLLRDFSTDRPGNLPDDRYEGFVHVLVIVDRD